MSFFVNFENYDKLHVDLQSEKFYPPDVFWKFFPNG